MREMSNATKKTRVGGYNPHRPTANSAIRRKDLLDPYHSMVSSLFELDTEELEACFLDASRDGNFSTIEQLLQHRDSLMFNIDARDGQTGNTALLWAAKRGHAQIVERLVFHGADVTPRNYEGQSAVEVASPPMRRLLLQSADKGAGHRNLLQAAWQGNAKVVKRILDESRVDIDCRNSDGLTPLLLVTRDVQFFEKLGERMNEGYDPTQVIAELLAHDANPNAADGDGKTPLHYVASSKTSLSSYLVEQLLHCGSDVGARDRRSFTPIHCAAQYGNIPIVVALLDGKSDVNARGFAGTTPLHVCAINGHDGVAVALLKHGADVTMVDENGLTPVEVAKTKKIKSTLKQAWAEATEYRPPAKSAQGSGANSKPPTEAKPVAPPRRKKTKGEVIFDSLPPASANGEQQQRFSANDLYHVERSRVTENVIHDMPNTTRRPGPMPYSRASRSPVRSGVRLSPLKASKDTARRDLKFGPGTKVHDGTSSRIGSASSAPTSSRVSADPMVLPPSGGQDSVAQTVTIVGLEVDEDIHDLRWKRAGSKPMPLKGHARRLSDTPAPSPIFSDVGEDFYLRSRSSRASILSLSLSLSDEWEDLHHTSSSPPNRLTPLHPTSLHPTPDQQRRNIKIPSTIQEMKLHVSPTTSASGGHQTGPKNMTPENVKKNQVPVTTSTTQDLSQGPNNRTSLQQASQLTDTESGKNRQPVISSSTIVPDADFSETQVRTSSDSGLPDEKGSSSKSCSVSSSSSNLSTGSPPQTMTHVDPRVALSHIFEAVGDASLLDNIKKVSSGDDRKLQKEASFRRHSDENVSPRGKTLRTLSKDTKSEEAICAKSGESHTAANQAVNSRSKLHQSKSSDKGLMSVPHVQSTEESIICGGEKTELNIGARSDIRHDVDIKSSSSEIKATKSTNCDNVKPSAAVGSHKTNTGVNSATSRNASVERKMQSNSNVLMKTHGSVAVKSQPLLVKTKQVLAKTPQPERCRPKLKQTTRPQPSGTKPQVTGKMNIQRVTSSQQATRGKTQQQLPYAVRSTLKKNSPIVPPRQKKHSITSISPAIQQLQRTPQKKFTSPTREPQHLRTNKPEQSSNGKILEAAESTDVKKESGVVHKSMSMKEMGSPVAEQKQLSSSAGSMPLTNKPLLDDTRHDVSRERHLTATHHGEHHPVLDTTVETPAVVKPTVLTRPAMAVDAPKVTQYTKILVDNAPDTLKQHHNISVEHTGPIIRDAFESLNKRKAEEARAMLEKQQQQPLKPKSAMKSRPSSSVKKQGAKSAVGESRPMSVKKSAKTKTTSEDILGKSKKGKAGKRGKSKKKNAVDKEKSDELGDDIIGNEWCDNVNDRSVTVVQSRLSLSSGGYSDDEYLYSKTSHPGHDLSAGVRSWHRADVDQTLPGQTQLVEPDEDLSLLPEHDSIVDNADLYNDVEIILDEVTFGVDDDNDTLLTARSSQSSESLRLQALKQLNDEETESENPLRQTDQAIRDFEGTVTETELEKMLETARSEKEEKSPGPTKPHSGITRYDKKNASSKPAEAEKPEEEDVNKIIEEILKSTPDPTKSISLKIKERKRRRGSGRRSKTMEDIAKELQRSQERTFRQLPTQLNHAEDDVSSDHTLTESNPKDNNSDPEKSSSSGELEAEQMQKLMNTVKKLLLRVDGSAEAPSSGTKRDNSAARRPPLGSKIVQPSSAIHLPPDGSQNRGGRKPEKSPRFVRRRESFFEVKGGAGSRRQSVSQDVADVFTNESFPTTSLPDVGTDDLVPQERAEVVTSRLGHHSASSRASSAATTVSSMASSEGEVINWKRGNMLGKGAYGTVWCGLTNLGELIAVKQIQLNIDDMERAEVEYEKIQEEVELLKTLNHKNIVGYLGTSLDDDVVSIFMQYVAGGSIANLLARFGALDEEVFRHYTAQILCGVQHLHASNIIHRDIKGGNVMIMHNGVVKLIDFGCAKRLCINIGYDCSHKAILKSMKGTPYWMAPEVVMETGHGTKSDIWSIGCTVFEMATKKPPWGHMAPMAAIFAIGTQTAAIPQLPGKFSSEARDFVNSCLIRNQDARWSAAELLQHPFIARHKKKSC